MFGNAFGQQASQVAGYPRPAPTGIGATVGGAARPSPFGMGGAGRSAGMLGGGGGMPGASAFGFRPQAQPMGSMFGGQRPAMPAQPAQQAAPAAARLGGMGFALSDERSKQKIQDLEALNRRYEGLLDEQPGAQYPELKQPDRTALDEAFRRPGSYSYEYKDPTMAGAAPGRQVGPMADELRGIPGAVERGSDGFDRVNLPRTTLATVSQVAKQRREIDDLRAQLEALGSPDELSTDGGDAVSRSFGR